MFINLLKNLENLKKLLRLIKNYKSGCDIMYKNNLEICSMWYKKWVYNILE